MTATEYLQLLRKWLVLSASQSPLIRRMIPKLASYPGASLLMRPAYIVFCGGATFEQAQRVARNLAAQGIGSIYDYVKEGALEQLDTATQQELIKMIKGCEPHSAVAIKMSALTTFGHLQRLSAKLESDETGLLHLLRPVLETASQCKVPVLFDAEQASIQSNIKRVAFWAMQQYPHRPPLIGNTYQMYLKEELSRLQADLEWSQRVRIPLLVKLVRGAYQATEPAELLQPSAEACHQQYDEAIKMLANQMRVDQDLTAIIASHNENSIKLTTDLIKLNPSLKSRLQFAQLLGMGDRLTLQLQQQGYLVSKYLPYGPAHQALPYLIRRMEENAAVAKRLDQELALVRQQLRQAFGKH